MEERSREAQELLAETFLFQGVEPEALPFALRDRRCTRERVPKGTAIYTPHRFRRCLGVVLEGKVQVNKGMLIMSVLEQGELFGAAALFHQEEDYATTLTAQTRCSLLFLSQELVEELMARFPQVGRNYVAYLSGRIRFLAGKIDALTAGNAERKLAQYLLSQTGDGLAEAEYSSAGLAKRLGVSRASLYRAYDALSARGFIRREGKRIRLLDEAGLRQW